MDGNIHPFPAPGPVLTVVDTTIGSARDHDDMVQALAAYLAANRAENAYATLVAACRRCGMPEGKMPIAWAKQRSVTWLAMNVAANNSLERAIGGGERLWAIDSDNGAA